MSTRCSIEFKDAFGSFNVYQHSDGYPSSIVPNIQRALKQAWELPRYEADECGAAYVAANKTGAGNLRLMDGGPRAWVKICDACYHYVVTLEGGELLVTVYTRSGDTTRRLFAKYRVTAAAVSLV